MIVRKTIAALIMGLSLSACAALKNPFSNGVDNTVLPGQRVDVLDTEQQVANQSRAVKTTSPTSKNTAVLGTEDPNCVPANPDYPECLTPADPAVPDAPTTPAIDEESAVAQ